MSGHIESFKEYLQLWLRAACIESSVAEPDGTFLDGVLKRIGSATAEWIGVGLQQGLITVDGNSFTVSGKGRWKWFSVHRPAPRCNWEAFLHVSYYVRLLTPCHERRLQVEFEDQGMDLTIRQGPRLLWYIEVKEKRSEAEGLIESLKSHGQKGVDLSVMDRRVSGRKRDPSIPKSKYLVQHRPRYFSVVASDVEMHFEVTYTDGATFTLSSVAGPLETERW